MKELSIIISVSPTGNMRKSIYQFRADPFTINAQAESSDSGYVYNCDQELTIENPDKDTLKEFSFGRSALVEFKDSTGHKFRIGTNSVPAVVYIAPNLNTSKLHIKCKMLQSPFIA